MELSFRLKKIADKVKNCTILADIGTDHAYIPIFLYKNEKIKKAFACDISKGSVKKAQENIIKHNLEKSIETRLGSGLLVLNLTDNVDTVVIAGMGGILTTQILEIGKSNLKNVKKIILQPQKNVDEVRRFLYKNNFKIVEDEMIVDNNKFYTVIVVKPEFEEETYTETDYLFGKYSIEKKCPVLKEYILKQINKLEKAINEIEKFSTKPSNLEKINSDYMLYKEVLKCL